MPDSLSRKTVPSNQDAERQVLGAILTSAGAIDQVAPVLKPEDFYIPKHQRIYRAVLELYTQKDAIDSVSVGGKVNDLQSTINDLIDGVRQPLNLDTHTKSVKQFSQRREILSVAQELAALAHDKELPEVQAYAKSVVTQVLTSDDERKSLLSPTDQIALLREMIADRKEGIDYGVSTGFKRLDQFTGGLQRGNLIVLGARTSVGKSSFAECVAENVAKRGHPVLFVSVEMDPTQMAHRMATRWGLQSDLLIMGKEDETSVEELARFEKERLDMPLYIWNAPGASTVGIRAHLNQLQAQIGGVDLVIIDYLQLLDDDFGGKMAEHLRLGKITKTLKQIAREYQIPILLITQLNRNSDQRGVLPEPRLSDIRESGRIEEDADLIMFLWREKQADALGSDTHLKIEKNRQGPLGIVPIIFNKPFFAFWEPSHAQLLQAQAADKDDEDDYPAGIGTTYGTEPVATGDTGPQTEEETEDGSLWP